jgi:hypothetical protein
VRLKAAVGATGMMRQERPFRGTVRLSSMAICRLATE